MNNRDFGSRGEDEATDYLIKQGYRILSRNYRVGRLGEIDIIGQDGETICFIEVKTRSSESFGTPAQAVSPSKQAYIRRLAQIYLSRNDLLDSPVRFDVIELMMARNGLVRSMNHIKNAF